MNPRSESPKRFGPTFVLFCAFALAALGAESDFAWNSTGTYRPPDFERVFPENSEGARRLEAALARGLQTAQTSEDPRELIRQGLRSLRVDRHLEALRSFGNAYVWNQAPQDPLAIELMYHAAGSTNESIHYNAVYFGLSVVRPKTEPILRTLVDLAMRSEEPNLLSRIAWGMKDQQADVLRLLAPHLESDDAAQRNHARVLQQILSGQLKAFEWAKERARQAAEQKYTGQLEDLRRDLLVGDSDTRRAALDLIGGERITLIMDESFIGAFSAAADDSDVQVRNDVAIAVGSTWIWNQTNQPTAAIDLMMRLSRDPAKEVRYQAMYYGLSVVHRRSDAVVERIFEMAMGDGIDNHNVRGRLIWGLREDRDAVRRVVRRWVREGGPIRGVWAHGFGTQFFGEAPDVTGTPTAELLESPDRVVAHLLAFGPAPDWKPDSMDEYWITLRQDLPSKWADRLVWSNNQGPPFTLAEESEVAEVEQALAAGSHFTILMRKPLSVSDLLHLGREGRIKTLSRAPQTK